MYIWSLHEDHEMVSGLWIRIHFMRIRIQQIFWMRIRIRIRIQVQVQVQLNQIWRKKSWRVFLSCKNIKDCSKVRNNGACANLLNKHLIKLQLLAISLHFFSFQLTNLPSWIRILILNADPDPGRKMNADPDPQPWMVVLSKALYHKVKFDLVLFKLLGQNEMSDFLKSQSLLGLETNGIV